MTRHRAHGSPMARMPLARAAVFAAGLLGCSGIPELETAYPTPPVTILEVGEARPLRGACGRPGWPLGLLYEPHHTEVRRAESRLQKSGLQGFACGPAMPGDSLRQYVGIRAPFGRLLYVNAIPGAPGSGSEPWRREATTDCEGGTAYWGALFDLEDDRFVRVDFNGGPPGASGEPPGDPGPGDARPGELATSDGKPGDPSPASAGSCEPQADG